MNSSGSNKIFYSRKKEPGSEIKIDKKIRVTKDGFCVWVEEIEKTIF